ncbi:MAG TPA: VCBS repeat-containing protein [Anditalea sp.]|nr:VCBS repeat-containing protein [Anditalea sp.]
MRTPILYIFLLLCLACAENKKDPALFELIPHTHTGIDFRNDLNYNEKFNPYTFRNFYNGAGVAIGDINNDGLVDILFAGNQSENKLYLNKGNFKFEDITKQAGMAVPGIWSTGVSMVDVNGDGFLDIYICKSGPLGGSQRHNELFINNGDLTFTEKAHEYGIADEGLSQHAVFFDYNKDGNIDMYLLNNSARSIGINDLRTGQRDIRDPFGGNKLYRNTGNKFIDVSEEAGIYGSAIGYGLGVTVADINRDGWPDLYVSNDFFEKDYLYINNADGTFTEALEEMMTEISMGSMGADIADLNNNGWLDIFVTEMLPATLERIKTKTPFEEWDKYQANVSAGYYHQFTRNTLQRNLGYQPGTDKVHLIDVARQSGVHATDWSWGALIFDADNDGLRDIFVANGIVKDLTDFDFVDYYLDNPDLVNKNKRDSLLVTKMIDEFPSIPQQNYLFQNLGDFKFKNVAPEVGMEALTFSTGAAYADLNNDGALDLVINNLNGEPSIYKNNSRNINGHHYLQLELGSNFGSQVSLYAADQIFYSEHNPVKGYMSSVDHRLHFGLGTLTEIDSMKIIWPNGSITVQYQIDVDQLLSLSPNSAKEEKIPKPSINPIYKLSSNQIPWKHEESEFIDFDRDRLRFHMISNEGPKIAIGDVNGDGLDDLFLPGAKGQASSIWIQKKDGSFTLQQEFEEDALAEDVAAVLFDANGNGHLDLYVASGSLEFGLNNQLYKDRLYFNDGNGQFLKSVDHLPISYESTSFVKVFDHNNDGHMDLLVGTRSIPYAYGVPANVSIYENNGGGSFTDKTEELSKGLKSLGLTRDAYIGDLDGDGLDELMIVGEWMPISIFKKQDGIYQNATELFGLSGTNGLYNTVHVLDFNEDGRPDFFVGNMGLNTRLLANPSQPLQMHVNDFDQNGSIEQILIQYQGSNSYPLPLKSTLVKQLPSLRKQLLSYDAYKDKTMKDLFTPETLSRSIILNTFTLETKLFLNQGNGTFLPSPLPDLLQSSYISAINSYRDEEGILNIFMGGNQSRIKPELGINMGSYGWMLSGKNIDDLKIIPSSESGVFIRGEIRDIKPIKGPNGKLKWLFVRNNEGILTLEK